MMLSQMRPCPHAATEAKDGPHRWLARWPPCSDARFPSPYESKAAGPDGRPPPAASRSRPVPVSEEEQDAARFFVRFPPSTTFPSFSGTRDMCLFGAPTGLRREAVSQAGLRWLLACSPRGPGWAPAAAGQTGIGRLLPLRLSSWAICLNFPRLSSRTCDVRTVASLLRGGWKIPASPSPAPRAEPRTERLGVLCESSADRLRTPDSTRKDGWAMKPRPSL